MSIHVAIVNGDLATTEALALLIRTTPGLLLGSTCRGGHTALCALQVNIPDVVLIEPNLTDVPPFLGVLQLRAVLRAVRVVVLSRRLDWHTVQLAVAAGAHGLLPLQAPPTQVLDAIFQVAAGGVWLDPRALRLLVERLQLEPGEMAALMDLSRREEEVLDGYARGFRAKEVAAWLKISTFTVQSHIRRIYQKLGARSTAHAVARYHPLGRFAHRRRDEVSNEGSA